VLPSIEHRIQETYDRLGHRWGWRFLASPARTLSPETTLAFVGLNPGGAAYAPPSLSCEAGNAYRLERWGPDGGLDRLQVQVRRMYEAVAARMPVPTPAVELMDATLAADFCPFRSPSWELLAKPEESVAFSRALWTDVLDVARPRVIISFGEAAPHLAAVMEEHGARRIGTPAVRPVGAGTVTYSTSRYASPHREILLVRLPHLTRFSLFGQPRSRAAVNRLATTIAEAVAD
jgi:hypothetical protein